MRKNRIIQKEQDDIIKKIIDILQLDEHNSCSLYELDNNEKTMQSNEINTSG